MNASHLILVSTTSLLAAGALRAQNSFAEGFDSQASANVTVQTESDTAVTFVDYSNMTIGSTTFSIPEAPRHLAGSAATRGVLIQANLTMGAAKAVNILAGTTPLTFSGDYRLSFDAWINVPVPLPSGSTEQLLWGVGTDGAPPLESRHNRSTGALGVYGWLAGENGYATEDAAINEGGVELADLGDQQPGEAAPFNMAFNQPILPTAPNNAPGNQWVRVDIDVHGLNVRVLFNGVEFFNVMTTLPASGFAMIGYEDPFNSLGSIPDGQWGLFDNFRVCDLSTCTTPSNVALQGTATGGMILSGGGDPTPGCPMTVRLKDGPVSSSALLTMGFPSPVTVPIPIGNCTLGVEVVGTLANLIAPTDAFGGHYFDLDIPAGAGLCGVSFGFQYFYLDNTACGVAHTEGLSMTIGN